MADIIDLNDEKQRRETEKLLLDVKNFKGFDTDLRIQNIPVHFTANVMGWADGSEHLRIVVYDTSGKYVRPAGAMRMTAAQWEQLKRTGDELLNAHRKFCEEVKKEEKVRG